MLPMHEVKKVPFRVPEELHAHSSNGIGLPTKSIPALDSSRIVPLKFIHLKYDLAQP